MSLIQKKNFKKNGPFAAITLLIIHLSRVDKLSESQKQ